MRLWLNVVFFFFDTPASTEVETEGFMGDDRCGEKAGEWGGGG